MNYGIYQAVGSLKRDIERYEKDLAKETNKWKRKSLESIISWKFERGLNMLQFAEENEVGQELVDWYLGRLSPSSDRPDIARFKRRLKMKMRERGRIRELPKKCPICGGKIKMIPGGVSRRTGKKYDTFWVCEQDCGFSCNAIKGLFRKGYQCSYPKGKEFKLE